MSFLFFRLLSQSAYLHRWMGKFGEEIKRASGAASSLKEGEKNATTASAVVRN